MKKLTLLSLLFTCFFSVYSQNTETNSNKVKRYYYRDSIVSIEKWYDNNKKLDSLKTYFNTGELSESFYYSNGRYQGMSYKFNKKGEKVTTWDFENGKLINREDHTIEFNKKDEQKIKKLHLQLKEVNDSLAIKPNRLKFLHKRASIRQKLDNYTLALNDYNRIEKRILRSAKARNIKPSSNLLGNIYDAKGSIYGILEMENFASHYKYKAPKVNPKNNRLKYNLASYLYTIKSYRLSLHYLNKVLEEWKGHAFSHRLLATIYIDFEDFEKAKYHIDLAFPKEKNLLKFGHGKLERDIRTLRGFISHNLGKSENGIVDLKEAIRLNEDNSFAHRNLGAVYYDLGDYKLACEHLQKAKNLGYEKIHDRDDLQAYLELSCENSEALKKSSIIKKEAVQLTKLGDKPFIYPNPTKGNLNVKNIDFIDFDYLVFDYTGKLLIQGVSDEKSLNISGLQSGVYILKINKNETTETFRVIKE